MKIPITIALVLLCSLAYSMQGSKRKIDEPKGVIENPWENLKQSRYDVDILFGLLNSTFENLQRKVQTGSEPNSVLKDFIKNIHNRWFLGATDINHKPLTVDKSNEKKLALSESYKDYLAGAQQFADRYGLQDLIKTKEFKNLEREVSGYSRARVPETFPQLMQ